ncbi:LOW QUALITY PROTEIN: cytochrome P450 734A6-like [Dioscorea cayenensis subsp. rotundata]|uniref:LOW QUALITY PROTEIN: cytochrome P450 734A6-like n=1 Tax=Dioscorea cayennensis subsp. rotundata TaxID=55577 RepID=A0AB40CUG3_DIOCR|nr:LOW QUALITY PROTEIN: cytochrome P450 734A6-like [Dioscorea cayenensis subsp. rotundata]
MGEEELKWVMVVVVVFVVGLSLVMGMKMVELLWWRPRRLEEHFSKQGIRGPPYRFFLGNVKEMVGFMLEASSKPMIPHNSHNVLPRVLSFYHHWKKIYGSTFLLWFGPTPRLTVSDPDLIREILVSRSDAFDRYESHPLVRQLEGDGLVSLRGEKWAHHRKVLTPTFHMDNLKLLIPYIGKTVLKMLEDKMKVAKASSSLSSEEEEIEEIEIDVSEWFHTVTEDTITRTAFGQSYDDGRAVCHLQAQQMTFAAEAFRKVLIPGYRFLPTKRNASSWRLDKEIKKNLVGLIKKRKESSLEEEEMRRRRRKKDDDDDDDDDDGQHEYCKDLLGQMIKASTPANEIVEECKTFFFAGKQTTSNLLTWTTVLLAMHPEWQELARHEVLRFCGSRDIPTSRDHLAKLKTLGMIINETLRLYPPAVATIRKAKVDVELRGYKIPQGTEILIPIMAVHHDVKIWGPDAAEFNPARFMDRARSPTGFIPFGVGPRMCIGKKLGAFGGKANHRYPAPAVQV